MDIHNFLSMYFPTYAPIIAWLLTIGIAIWNNQKQKNERIRKEHKEECKDVIKTIQEIKRNFSTYHSLSERSENIETQIKILFEELEFTLESFLESKEFNNICTNPCRQKKEDLYDIATGQYFESSLTVPTSNKQKHSQKISQKANALIKEVKSIFRSRFD